MKSFQIDIRVCNQAQQLNQSFDMRLRKKRTKEFSRMSMLLIALNAAGIVSLVFAIYLPRHKQHDLAFALIGLNVGVHVVCTALLNTDAASSLGFGLGLFGVLSIIRLRSAQISQREVAYYVAALAIALITGGATTEATAAILVAVVLGGIAIAEYLPLLQPVHVVEVRFDTAMPRVDDIKDAAKTKFGVDPVAVSISKVDEVDDLTIAQLTYRETPAIRLPKTNSFRDGVTSKSTVNNQPVEVGI